MKTNVKINKTEIPNVFKQNSLAFDIDFPAFIKEVIENSDQKMYAKCWDIFICYMRIIAKRATELNDEVLNVIMIRMNMYDVPLNERKNIIKQLEEEYNKRLKEQNLI